MEFTPSQYQIDIFNFVENPSNGSLFIEATAGSGKTTSIIEAAKRIKSNKAIFLAYNRHIADELKTRLPSRITTLTLHQLGKQEWEYKQGGRVTLNKNKIDFIIDERILKDKRFRLSTNHIWKLRGIIKKMVSRAKMSGMECEGSERYLISGSDENWKDSAHTYREDISDKMQLDYFKTFDETTESGQAYLDYSNLAIDVVKDILRINAGAKRVIDFDDMLYFPYTFGGEFFELDYVFVDELQDLSPLQIEVVKLCTTQTTRVIGVGDRRQAVYQFRCADERAVEKFISMFNCEQLPLPVTYRCPTSVVELAQEYNPNILPWEKAKKGVVATMGNEWTAQGFKESDFILGRNNAPVLAMALSLINEDVKVQFVGKDISAGIQRIIKSIGETDKETFSLRFEAWHKKQSEKLKKKVRPSELVELTDQYFCLRLLLSKLKEDESVDKCMDILHEIFDSKRGVRLSTIHRSKGLEAERVFMLDFEKFDPLLSKDTEPELAELNLAYVGVTRAKSELIFINTPGWFKSRYYTEDGKMKAGGVNFDDVNLAKQHQRVK